jgi:hypothetical protein
MEKVLKEICWNDLYKETIPRLTYIKDCFRTYYSIEELSEEDLDKYVVYTMGIYGQEHVYDIWLIIKNHQCKEVAFKQYFGDFVEAFKCLGEENFNVLKPKNFIHLFLEYIYSLMLKGNL